MVATRLIRQYEIIMLDYASLVIDLSFPTRVRRAQGYEVLHQATDHLSDPDRVLSLGRSSTVAADIVEDVLRTNAFHTMLADTPHMALYPQISVW